MVVEAFRLGCDNARLRMALLDGERDPADQPAARGRHDHDVGLEPQGLKVLDDLPPGGSLPRHDEGIVEGGHQRCIALAGDAARDLRAVLAIAVIEHDLGAVRGRALKLQCRCIARHHDQRRHAEELGRRRHALGMVAGGIGHHPGGTALRRDAREAVIGAAEFE